MCSLGSSCVHRLNSSARVAVSSNLFVRLFLGGRPLGWFGSGSPVGGSCSWGCVWGGTVVIVVVVVVDYYYLLLLLLPLENDHIEVCRFQEWHN